MRPDFAAVATRKRIAALFRQVMIDKGLREEKELHRIVNDAGDKRSFLRNFRRGFTKTTYYAQVFGWLEEKHPSYAARLRDGDNVDATRPGESWTQLLLQDWARSLTVVPLDPSTANIVTFAHRDTGPTYALKLGTSFCFHAVTDIGGAALAMQGFAGQWYPLPLSEDAASCRVPAGAIALPAAPGSQEPLPLIEEDEAGRHRFVVIISGEEACASMATGFRPGVPIDRGQLDRIARALPALPETAWRIFRTTIVFSRPDQNAMAPAHAPAPAAPLPSDRRPRSVAAASRA